MQKLNLNSKFLFIFVFADSTSIDFFLVYGILVHIYLCLLNFDDKH